MQSVFGDRKPNLLIIDEIDGLAPGEGKVNLFLYFIIIIIIFIIIILD